MNKLNEIHKYDDDDGADSKWKAISNIDACTPGGKKLEIWIIKNNFVRYNSVQYP